MKGNGLGTISLVKENFGSKLNKDLIKGLIVHLMPISKRKEIEMTQSIYESLKSGKEITITDEYFIPCATDNIDFQTDKRNVHQRLLNRMYTKD